MIPIMISVDSFHDGGAEMFAIRLANNLPSSYNVHFMEYNTKSSKSKHQSKLINDNIKVFVPDNSFLIKVLDHLFSFIKLFFRIEAKGFQNKFKYLVIKSYIKKYNIKIIHSHAIENNNMLCLLKREIPYLKLIMTLHGHYEIYRNNMSEADFAIMMDNHIKHFDFIVYLSHHQLETFKTYGLSHNNVKLILNGIDKTIDSSNYSALQSREELKLILVSRAIKEKGWIEALDTVVKLNKEGFHTSLQIIGEGPLLEDVKSLYPKPFIHFMGYKNNVFDYIAEAHIGILPSYSECLPNTIVEYLLMGKPVVASNVGSIKLMLEHKDDIAGDLLYNKIGEPVDVNEFISVIKKYFDSQYYKRKSDLTLKAAEKFAMELCINNYHDLYISMVAY